MAASLLLIACGAEHFPSPTVPVPSSARTAPVTTGSVGIQTDPSESVGIQTGSSGSPAGPTTTDPTPAGSRTTDPTPATTPTAARPLTIAAVETVATGLSVPWGLAFLPDGSALVSERDSARVLRIRPDGSKIEAGRVSGVEAAGEGGLLGLAVDPQIAASRTVFVYYTAEADNRIARMTWDGSRLSDRQGRHPQRRPVGLRVGRVPVRRNRRERRSTVGAGPVLTRRQNSAAAQRRHRRTRQSVPAGSARLQPRPSERAGLAFDAQGRLWASEFGQNTWDELNLVQRGDNGGWPEVEGEPDDSRFAAPIRVWSTSEASPSGVAIAGGSIWMAGRRGERLWQIPLAGSGTQPPIAHLDGEYGRLRTVVTAPDGTLWLTTSNTDGRGDPRDGDDRILRLTLG